MSKSLLMLTTSSDFKYHLINVHIIGVQASRLLCNGSGQIELLSTVSILFFFTADVNCNSHLLPCLDGCSRIMLNYDVIKFVSSKHRCRVLDRMFNVRKSNENKLRLDECVCVRESDFVIEISVKCGRFEGVSIRAQCSRLRWKWIGSNALSYILPGSFRVRIICSISSNKNQLNSNLGRGARNGASTLRETAAILNARVLNDIREIYYMVLCVVVDEAAHTPCEIPMRFDICTSTLCTMSGGCSFGMCVASHHYRRSLACAPKYGSTKGMCVYVYVLAYACASAHTHREQNATDVYSRPIGEFFNLNKRREVVWLVGWLGGRMVA